MTQTPRKGLVSALLGKFGLKAKADASGLAQPETPNVETKGALANPESWLFELFNGGSPTSASVYVSPLTAMTCAPWRCGVQAIAETIGQLPVQIYQRGENNSRERTTDHPLYGLLHDNANEWTPASTFREQLTRDALLWPHGGFAFINRVNGKPVELIRFDPRHTQVTPIYENSEPAYRVTGITEANAAAGDVGMRILSWRDVIHIASPSETPFGLVQQHANHLFGRGARPAGILKFKNRLDPTTSARMRSHRRLRCRP